MATKKLFGVLLTDDGWHDLDEPLKPYTSEGAIGKYIYCKKVHPDGPYFVMLATCTNPDGSEFEAEISIPHRYVKCIVTASEKGGMGFLASRVQS
jgi:hypothetical protein